MGKINRRFVPVFVLIAVCGAATGCQRESDGATPVGHTDSEPRMRVVSLAPALTQMIVDMGLEQLLVGVAQYDAAAPTGLPIVGNWQDINTELLLALRPTHVLTMTGRHQAAPPQLNKLASSHGFQLTAYRSPMSISDITNILLDDQELADRPKTKPIQCLGIVLDATSAALQATMRMSLQLAHVSNVTADVPRPDVLLVIGANPFMASGPGTVHDQLLSFCGGHNAAAHAHVSAPVYDKEKLLQANPDVILMLLPNAPPLGPIDTDPRLAPLRGLSIPAVQHNRVVLVNDPLVQLPSSSIARVAVAMAKAIHPELAESIDRKLRANPSLGATFSLSAAGLR